MEKKKEKKYDKSFFLSPPEENTYTQKFVFIAEYLNQPNLLVE